MLDRIKAALSRRGIDVFLIRRERRETAELFFVKKRLDMRRVKDVTLWTVTVYRDFAEDGVPMRGSSQVSLSPDAGDEELARSLEDAYAAAGCVKNPAFELYAGTPAPETEMPSGFRGKSLMENAWIMAGALFAADTRSDAFLNSAEVFLTCSHVHLWSSAGTDTGYEKIDCKGEFVVQCKEPQDVEQYFDFAYAEPDTASLTEKAARALETVCDRAHAVRRPRAGVYDVVLSGENLKEILGFYVMRSNAAMVFPHYSDYAPGKVLQGEGSGEKLNLTFLPETPCSDEGIPMGERELTRDGTLLTLHGDTRMCRYLGMEPTGTYHRLRAANGTVPFETLRRGCLYPVSFSDFQMDPMSGHFGGEIRLAYLVTDEGVELVTGGSVNGSFLEKQGELVFSTERYTDADYDGPLAVRIPGVNVSGE